MKKLFYIFLITGCIACSYNELQDISDGKIGMSYEMISGQQLHFPDEMSNSDNTSLTLTLDKVNNSFCPEDATCVWAGNFIAEFSLQLEDTTAHVALCAGSCRGVEESDLRKDSTTSENWTGTDYKTVTLKDRKYKVTMKDIGKDKGDKSSLTAQVDLVQ